MKYETGNLWKKRRHKNLLTKGAFGRCRNIPLKRSTHSRIKVRTGKINL